MARDMTTRRENFFPKMINDNNYVKCVEIGVYKGAFSEILLNKCPSINLHSVDLWIDMEGKPMDEIMEGCKVLLSPYADRNKMVKGDSLTASAMFEDNSLDFVYIDADHSYESTMADILAWIPKVRVGGVLAGHDYTKKKTSNKQPLGLGHGIKGSKRVAAAVDDFIKLNPHDLQLTGGIPASWWFIKE